MSFAKFLTISSLTGLMVPTLLTGVWWLVNSATTHNLAFAIEMERLTLMLWPSSFALLAGAGATSSYLSWSLTAVAVAINVIVYAGLGALGWYGVKKSRAVLVLPVALIATLWLWALFIR